MAEKRKHDEEAPAVKERPPGFAICDVCGGVLFAKDAPRHSTHTRAELIAANKERDEEAEAAEQHS